MQDVNRAWDTMLTKLEMPTDREWRPYVLRHSLARLVRNRGAEKWEMEASHEPPHQSQTEVYPISEFPIVVRAVESVLAEIEKRAPGSLHQSVTGNGSLPHPAGARKVYEKSMVFRWCRLQDSNL